MLPLEGMHSLQLTLPPRLVRACCFRIPHTAAPALPCPRPSLLLSCQAFFFDVVSKTEAVACKHQLAVRLADALKKTRVQTVSDTQLAHLLQE